MRHVIQKQQFLLTIPDGIDAFHAQHEASRYFRDQILPALEKIFDELSVDGEVIHLDYLFIDLGRIGDAFLRSGRLDDELYKLLKEVVESAIGKELAAHPRIRQTVGQRVLMQWWYYMEHGYLPWNATGVPDEWPQKVLELYAVDFAAVTKLRKSLLVEPRILTRIVARHSEWFLENLVAVLTSARQEGLSETIDQVCRVNLFLEERHRVLEAAGADRQGKIVMGHVSIRRALQLWSRRMAGFLGVPAREKKEFVWRWLLVEAAIRPVEFVRVGGVGRLQAWIFDDSRIWDGLSLMEMVLAEDKFADNSEPFIRLVREYYVRWKDRADPQESPAGIGRDDIPLPPDPGAAGPIVRAGEVIVPGRDAEDVAERMVIPIKRSMDDPGKVKASAPESGKDRAGVDVRRPVEAGGKEKEAGGRPEGTEDGEAIFSERRLQGAAMPDIGSEKKGEVVEDTRVDAVSKKEGSVPAGEDREVKVPTASSGQDEDGRELVSEERRSTDVSGGEGEVPLYAADESDEAEILPAGKDKVPVAADMEEALASGVEAALRPEEYLFRAGEVTEEGIYLVNAGIILIHPFLSTFFGRLGLWKEGAFVDLYARQRAVALLHFLATGEREGQEYALVLAKVLCGHSVEMPLPREIVLTEEECGEGVLLLENVIRSWEKIGNTSVEGLRQGFLRRDGKLSERGGRLYLQMEISGIDVLLDYLPWNLGIVKLPWLKEILFVEWR